MGCTPSRGNQKDPYPYYVDYEGDQGDRQRYGDQTRAYAYDVPNSSDQNLHDPREYSATDSRYPDEMGRMPPGRYPDEMGRMPPGRYPDEMGRMPPGRYPDEMGRMPPGQYPDEMGRMPPGQYPDEMTEIPDSRYMHEVLHSPGDLQHAHNIPLPRDLPQAPDHLIFREDGRFHPRLNQIIDIDNEVLEEYINLERMIRTLERRRVLQRLRLKVTEYKNIVDEIEELENRQKSIKQNLEHRSSNPDDYHADWKTRWAARETIYESAESKLLRNLEEAVSKDRGKAEGEDLAYALEIVSRMLEKRQKRKRNLTREIEDLNGGAAQLLDLYLRLDEYLATVLTGPNANKEINQLEDELFQVENREKRLELASCKWQESQMMLEFACRQMSQALQLWQNLAGPPTMQIEVRYNLDERAPSGFRVNKYIQTPEGIVRGIGSPSITSETIERLNQSSVHEFLESMDPLELLNVEGKQPNKYTESYIRALILLHWFDQVLNTSLQRDLTDVGVDVRKTAQALRRERLLLIQEKMRTVMGGNYLDDSGMDSDTEEDLKAGFENLFYLRPPSETRRLDKRLYSVYNSDRYDLQGDLQRMESTSRSLRARTANQLRTKLNERKVRRGIRTGELALEKAVNVLRTV